MIHGWFMHLPFHAAEQIESDLIIYKLYELLLLFMGDFVHLLRNPTPVARFFEPGCPVPVIAGLCGGLTQIMWDNPCVKACCPVRG